MKIKQEVFYDYTTKCLLSNRARASTFEMIYFIGSNKRETPAPSNLLQIPLWIEFISFPHNLPSLVKMAEIVLGSEKGCQNMRWGGFKYFQSGNSLIYALKSLTSILSLSYSERFTSYNIPDARREKERETPAPPNLLQIPLCIEFISFPHNLACLVIMEGDSLRFRERMPKYEMREFKYFQSGISLIYALKSLTSILSLTYSERYTSNNMSDARIEKSITHYKERERETPAPPNLLQIPLWIEFISIVHNLSCLVIMEEIVLGSEKGYQNMCWGEFKYFQSGNSLIYASKSLTSILPLSYSERRETPAPPNLLYGSEFISFVHNISCLVITDSLRVQKRMPKYVLEGIALFSIWKQLNLCIKISHVNSALELL
ncbi:hypothetical protein CDAR_498941 [Caerostris darwini]|uniref:Maturase K n=1 Tax=Caerostris darwini TaxID=1538125 RepID=A0AAV4PYU7_9ARAC|nr:hypothetical protein CDAR_498941 [Caerostris darwini]